MDDQGLERSLQVLRRRKWLILLCLLVVSESALGLSLLQPKEYDATAQLLFRDPQLADKVFGSTVLAPSIDPDREAATNDQLASLEEVADRTSRLYRGRLTLDDIRAKVSVQSTPKSNVVAVTASDSNPAAAARLANAYAEQYIAFRREADRSKIDEARGLVDRQYQALSPVERAGRRGRSLQDRSEQLQIVASLQTGNAELVGRARPPEAASSPKPLRNSILGAVVGLMLGVALALLLERLDRRLKDIEEVRAAFDRPILGVVPESRTIGSDVFDLQQLPPQETEAFRLLRANLRYFNVERPIRSVLVTSSAAEDGKSTVALNLAAAAAESGSRVLLLEADLRRPHLAERLRIQPGGGLSQVLAGVVPLRDAIVSHPVSLAGKAGERQLDIVVAGFTPPNPHDLIESDMMQKLLVWAESAYDLVVVDTPPTSAVSDAIPLIRQVSGVIVVCRLGKSTRDSAAELRGQLANLGANTLGVVINSMKIGGRTGYGYDYTAAPEAPSPETNGHGTIPSGRSSGDEADASPRSTSGV